MFNHYKFIMITAMMPMVMLIFCFPVSLSLKNSMPISVDRIIEPPEYTGNKNDPSIIEIAYVFSHWNKARIIPIDTAKINVTTFIPLEAFFCERIKKQSVKAIRKAIE